MNFAEKENLPDTQEFFSEDESQCYMDHSATAPIWAKLVYLPNPKITVGEFLKSLLKYCLCCFFIDLRLEKAWFGRENPCDKNTDAFIFTTAIMPSKMVDRISKCHFTIEIKTSDVKSSHNHNPAVLTCRGRNGIYINDDKMMMDNQRILAHNDTIKLIRRYEMFRFSYTSTPAEVETLPRLCLEKYHIGIQIGSGGCGIVRLVHNLKTLGKFAMKVIKKETNPMVRSRLADNQKILNEVDIMRKLSHAHVLSLTDFFETPDRVVIIMEYMSGGDLLNRITKYDETRKNLTEMDAKFFFLQVCRGIKYLHDSFVTHRDIKPDNILLDSNSPDALLKISDFGLSKLISVDSMKTVCGTQLYVAPEVLMGGAYTNKVDIWSMGCMLFAMLSGSVPFCDGYGPPDVQTQIKQAKFAFKSRVWNNVSLNNHFQSTSSIKKNSTFCFLGHSSCTRADSGHDSEGTSQAPDNRADNATSLASVPSNSRSSSKVVQSRRNSDEF